jgi:hypothetical protein
MAERYGSGHRTRFSPFGKPGEVTEWSKVRAYGATERLARSRSVAARPVVIERLCGAGVPLAKRA